MNVLAPFIQGTSRPRKLLILSVAVFAFAGAATDVLFRTLTHSYDHHQVAWAFLLSSWGLVATYLVLDHIVEVRERYEWRQVADTSIGSLDESLTKVARLIPTATHDAIRYDGSAKESRQVPNSELYVALKSFDRVFEILSPLLLTTPDLGTGYKCLSEWRMAAWQFHHRLRDGKETEANAARSRAQTHHLSWSKWVGPQARPVAIGD